MQLSLVDISARESPFYNRLGELVLSNRFLRSILKSNIRNQESLFLFFASVNYLNASGEAKIEFWGDVDRFPFERFADYCYQHRKAIETIISTRVVATNEVRRAAILRLGLAFVVRYLKVKRLATAEIGCSAGFLSALDRYKLTAGINPMILELSLGRKFKREITTKNVPPSLLNTTYEITTAVGYDKQPLDLANEEHINWLRASCWPDCPSQFAAMEEAIEEFSANPPTTHFCDIAHNPSKLFDSVPEGIPLCIISSWIRLQMNPGELAEFEKHCSSRAQKSPTIELQLEPDQDGRALLSFVDFSQPSHKSVLSSCSYRGLDIDWVAS